MDSSQALRLRRTTKVNQNSKLALLASYFTVCSELQNDDHSSQGSKLVLGPLDLQTQVETESLRTKASQTAQATRPNPLLDLFLRLSALALPARLGACQRGLSKPETDINLANQVTEVILGWVKQLGTTLEHTGAPGSGMPSAGRLYQGWVIQPLA